MLAFRSFVAVLVAVLTLLGGAFRASAVDAVQGRLAIERASHDDDQGTLDRGRAGVQVRTTKPSGPRVADSLATPAVAMRERAIVDRNVGPIACVDAVALGSARRVRVHAENMVFLN